MSISWREWRLVQDVDGARLESAVGELITMVPDRFAAEMQHMMRSAALRYGGEQWEGD